MALQNAYGSSRLESDNLAWYIYTIIIVVFFFLTMHTIILVCISGIRIEFPFKKIDWINERVMVFNANFNNITVISWRYMINEDWRLHR
jgi:hypothetical protein